MVDGAMTGVAQVDGTVLARDLKKAPLLWPCVLIIHATRRYGEDDVIVTEVVAGTMEGVRHLAFLELRNLDGSRCWCHSPPFQGGVAAPLIKCREASEAGADGVVSKFDKCGALRGNL